MGDVSCTCQNQYVQKYINKKNETPLQHPLDYINEKLNWIKKKKRLLFEEIYTNQAPISDMQSINNISDMYRDYPTENLNYVGLPDSFCNSTLKILEEYVKNKKIKTSKSNNNNNNNTWINKELMNYICNLLKMSPNEIDNLSVSSNSNNQLEQSILEISKANLEYHKDILNYISQCLDSNMCDINRDQAFSSPQYIGLLDKLYKLADYYTEKAHEMRNICLESPRVEINNTDTVEEISELKHGNRKSSCSISSEFSVDGTYMLEHLSSLLEQRGLIRADGEWPIFGNEDEDDSRSLTDQLLDIKPHIKSEKENMHESPNIYVRSMCGITDEFGIRECTHQGLALSPYIVMKEILGKVPSHGFDKNWKKLTIGLKNGVILEGKESFCTNNINFPFLSTLINFLHSSLIHTLISHF
ncbi:Hypothetical protein CINCED_3A010395 [Cinara cedri]|uniref:Uncharacterized protein n=1 Tax=Cinara cedri TaxID=506608 RepID=A0A5E4M4S7_9HEMI|nr:Hypothetical protein CINCED_3A010395 [Cinara cedri]